MLALSPFGEWFTLCTNEPDYRYAFDVRRMVTDK
jgi:hypothetical protein